MPISPRLSGKLYKRILNLAKSANDFLFFGTYSLSIDRGILNQIVKQKQSNPNLLVACLLPPPTDFILWDFTVRWRFLQAYGLTGSNQVELARAVAENPQPAYKILEGLWSQSSAVVSQRQVTSHIERIGRLYQNGIISFLEPNMHAKFVASESNIYEGSGNLTLYGLSVNVEVYNFYPRTYRKVYQYAARSYVNFLYDYLTNFVDWKYGSHYLTRANQLGQRIEQIATAFGIKFNPKVSQEKINALTKSREKMAIARSELWQLPGHKLLLNLDFSLSMAELQIREVLASLWKQREKEIESEQADSIEKDLEKIILSLKKVGYTLKNPEEEKTAYLSGYEKKYLEKNLEEAQRFIEYLADHKENERKSRG
jgi:hypothetical protein